MPTQSQLAHSRRLPVFSTVLLLLISSPVFAWSGPNTIELKAVPAENLHGGDMVSLTAVVHGSSLLSWSQNESPFNGGGGSSLTILQGETSIGKYTIDYKTFPKSDGTLVQFLPCQTVGCPNGSIKTSFHYKNEVTFTVNVRLPETLGQTSFKAVYSESYSQFNSRSSPVLIVDHSQPAQPGAPQSPTLVDQTHTITWGASTTADTYRLERLSEGVWTSVYIGPDTFWTAYDMSGGMYQYRVVACKNSACSAPSAASAILVLADLISGEKRDVNGDGLSDLTWRSAARDNLSSWLMNGGVRVNGLSSPVGSGWAPVASGDFQGDGVLDFIWTDGRQMQMWAGTGTSYIGIPIRDYPSGYHAVAVGDVDGNGMDDLVWRDDAGSNITTWLMNGAEVASTALYPIPQPWRVLAGGDLDGNGKLDLIWTNGEVIHAWMGGSQGFAGVVIGQYPAGWELLAAYDVDGDGKADLLWNNSTALELAYWRMDGGAILSRQGFPYGASWKPLQVGDYNGDGKADIVWTDGQAMQQWSWTGTSFVGVAMPSYPAGWSLLKR